MLEAAGQGAATAKAKAPRGPFQGKRQPGCDRWGYPPPERGWMRGMIFNVARGSERTTFGERVTVDFDIYPDDETAPIQPVRMIGYTFSQEIRPGMVVEAPIGRVTPGEVLMTDELRMPWDVTSVVRAHRPVEETARRDGRDRVPALLAIILPVLVVIALIWLLWRSTGGLG